VRVHGFKNVLQKCSKIGTDLSFQIPVNKLLIFSQYLDLWVEREGDLCSGQFLTCIRIKTCVPSHQKLPRTDNMVCKVELLPDSFAQWFSRSHPFLRNQGPWGHSSFRGIYCPKDDPHSGCIITSRTILSDPSKTVIATVLLDIRQHSWIPLPCQLITYFKCCNNS